jgi:hypothetical protein
MQSEEEARTGRLTDTVTLLIAFSLTLKSVPAWIIIGTFIILMISLKTEKNFTHGNNVIRIQKTKV